MTTERESGLALMNINYERAINVDEIRATHHPRHLLFANILSDDHLSQEIEVQSNTSHT